MKLAVIACVNAECCLYINNWVKRKMRVLHWPQGRVAELHVCKKGMQHSLTVACTCVIDNSCLIALACVNGSGRFCICKWADKIAYVKVKNCK